MDYLRDAIECLFVSTDVQNLLKDMFRGRFLQYRYVDSNSLTSILYEKNCMHATLDQMQMISDAVVSLWMLPSDNEYPIKYSRNASVFNVLLHFSEGIVRDALTEPICDINSILRWQQLTSVIGEDLLVTSYLAAFDAQQGRNRNFFCWEPYLRTDSKALNALLKKKMADVHNHLQGSSLNFDLNWLGLMNHLPYLVRKDSEFNKIDVEIRKMASQASLIRIYLFDKLIGYHSINYSVLKQCLVSDTSLGISQIENNLLKYKSQKVRTDYAITNTLYSNNKESYFLTLSGERFFLYQMFSKIYAEKERGDSDDVLFWAYLILKNRIRRFLVQYNSGVGFGNFNYYEKRKKIFIPRNSQLYPLVDQLAVATFMGNTPDNRYLETRIAPDNTVPISIQLHQKRKVLGDEKAFPDSKSWNYDFVFHFIKTKPTRKELRNPLQCRNYSCRNATEFAARAIAKYATAKISDTKKLVGIDAANSEMNCRPEVFSQAYRMLRDIPMIVYDKGLTKIISRKSIGITYHVGEDFYDIVDGLRALDEVFRFMQYQRGDRIGHGLVVGTDVKKYYEARHFTIMAPRQVLLDNIVWLHHYMDICNIHCKSLNLFLEEQYERIFRVLYPHESLPMMSTYFASWKLRGDNPVSKSKSNGMDVWHNYGRTPGVEYALARMNVAAHRLWYKYHYDVYAKEEGEKSIVLKIEKNLQHDWVNTITKIQRYFLDLIIKKEISIETNPTSNVQIGEFNRYDELPIRQWETVGQNISPEQHVNVSINTDDKGVFGTSIEREYALMFAAMIKVGETEYGALKWLDNIRFHGLEQAFNYTPQSETEYAPKEGSIYLKEAMRMAPQKSCWKKISQFFFPSMS